MMKMKSLLGLCLICVPLAGFGADSNGRFAIKGAGAAYCERYAKARADKSPEYNLYSGWVSGYLTAVNQYSKNTFDVASWESVGLLLALLDGHCVRNPKDRFYKVVESMSVALVKNQLDERSPPVEVKVGERKLVIYEEVLRRVQKVLAKAGFYEGEPDGQFGPGTRKAIEAFQREKKLEVTGTPDQRTLLRLFRPKG